MPANEIRFIETRFPMVCVEFHGACTDEQFVEYLERMSETRQRAQRENTKLVYVIDTLHSTKPVTAKQRQMQAESMKAQGIGMDVLAGMAFVIDNTLIRGVLTAILWVQRMRWDHTVVSSRTEAEQWATSTLARAQSLSA